MTAAIPARWSARAARRTGRAPSPRRTPRAIEAAVGYPAPLYALIGHPVTWIGALIARLARPAFRLYASDDVIGAEIGGAVKNVLAIGCGVVEGVGGRAPPVTRRSN